MQQSFRLKAAITVAILGCSGSPLLHSQSQSFLIHGSSKSCSDITQLDSALTSGSQMFFSGWNAKDYDDALAWSQACANYGWHIPGQPRIPMLEAQRARSLGAPVAALAPAPPSASSAVVEAPVAVASVTAPPADAAASVPATAPVQAESQATPLPAPASLSLQPLPAAGSGGMIAGARVERSGNVEADEDSLLTDQYFKQHFHHESVWVASKANLDIGTGSALSAAQMKNRITADKIVIYCAHKANSGEAGANNHPLLWDWRWCEAEEAAAYNRLVAQNEFPSAGRAVLLGCAAVESYVYLERCMQSLTEASMAPAGNP